MLANAELACGLHYILPDTGMTATPDGFAEAIMTMRARHRHFAPRAAVLDHWTWPHSVARIAGTIAKVRAEKN